MPQTVHTTPLRLECTSGQPMEPVVIAPGTEATLGRSNRCGVVLPDDTVSRTHAVISQPREGCWLLTDQGSRHGTIVNGEPLAAGESTLLEDGTYIRLGPYTFLVRTSDEPGTFASTITDRPDPTVRIEEVGAGELGLLARQRLDLLVECAASIHGSGDERTLADAVLQSALAGTGFHHAALLRPRSGSAEQFEVLGYRRRDAAPGAADSEPSYSQTLLLKASAGQVVRLTEPRQVPVSVSIAELGITSALCAPVPLGPSIAAYLYLDARGAGAAVEPDAAGFCQVIARMCGLALANLKRLEIERRHRDLRAEITAAREAQQLIVPAAEGRTGGLRYAMQMRPGRFVAGDLFDVVELPGGRTAVFIGDVTGEGVGAGVIMAACQAHLHSELRRGDDPATAVQTVNRYVAPRMPEGKFVSLWVGLFDPGAGTVHCVDAGHGHWLHKPAGAPARRVEHDRIGFPLGVEPEAGYEAITLQIAPGDRLVLYSDGLVEQRAADGGERFGRDRVIAALEGSGSALDDVRIVMDAIRAFAARSDLDDDTTVASVEVSAEG